jgi:hypothetical protein
MPGGGAPGSWWKAEADGSGSDGAALTSVIPLVCAAMPTPAAMAAAAANRFIFIVRVPPQTHTTLVTSCLVGYAENHQQRRRRYRLAVIKIVKYLIVYVPSTYCEDRAEGNAQIREPTGPESGSAANCWLGGIVVFRRRYF